MPEPIDEQSTSQAQRELTPRRGNRASDGVSHRGDDDPFGASIASSITEDTPPPPVSIASLMRRKRTIVTVAGVVAALVLPVVWTQVKPEFKSTATVRIAPVRPKILYPTDSNQMPPLYQNFVNTQVAMILSPEVLDRVLKRDEVKATRWYQNRPWSLIGSPPSQMERLSADLLVTPRNGTELIDVAMSTIFPGEAATFVNAAVQEFEAVANDQTHQSETQRLATLRKALTDVTEEVRKLIDDKYAQSELVGTGTPEEIRTQKASDLSRAKAELERLKMDQNLAAFARERSRNKDGKTRASATDRQPSRQFLSDANWLRYNEDLRRTRQRLELAQQQFGPSHPRIKQLKTEVVQAEQMLADTERRLIGLPATASSTALVSADGAAQFDLNNELRSMRKRELGKLIDKLEVELRQTGDIARKIARLDENITEKTRLREDIRSELQRQEVEQDAPGRISMCSMGMATALPTRDRRPLFSLFGLCLAALTGVGFAYLRSSVDTNIYEVKDVAQVVSAPFLGRIPRVRNPLAGGEDPASELPLREAIRMVRTALLTRLTGVTGPALVVTSPGPSAGKTTTAILLARSLARLGKKVLVVDADLRQPALSWKFDAGGKPGLRDVLAGEFTETDVVRQVPESGFAFLSAGTYHGDGDSELLANGVLAAAIARWKSAYDLVLIDSPPILPVADARILAGHADGTVMVLRASQCRRADAVEAYAELSAAGARLLGSVLVASSDPLAAYPYQYSQDASGRKLELIS